MLTVTDIPLNRLVPSPVNVRRTGQNARVEELAASIHAHGLLQNLTVRVAPAKRKSSKNERFEVVAGGRRLAALTLLAKQELIAADAPVRWRDFYALKKTGAPRTALAEAKAALVARQKEALEQRCREAAQSLRAGRDLTYQGVLSGQKEMRADLVDRQEQGLMSPHLCQGPSLPGQTPPVTTSDIEAEIPTTRGPVANRHAANWTWRAGLVAQQRSASRQARRSATDFDERHPRAVEPTERRSIGAGPDRRRAKDKTPGAAIGVEPDG